VAAAERFQFTEAIRSSFRDQGSEVIQPHPTLAEVGRELVRTQITDEAEYRRVIES
jgi:hypothetical protein